MREVQLAPFGEGLQRIEHRSVPMTACERLQRRSSRDVHPQGITTNVVRREALSDLSDSRVGYGEEVTVCRAIEFVHTARHLHIAPEALGKSSSRMPSRAIDLYDPALRSIGLQRTR